MSTLVRRRPRWVVVPLAAALAFGAACSSNDDTTTPDTAAGPVDLSTVTLKVGDQKAGTKALLGAAGLLDDLPYKIEWSSFTSGPPLLEALAADAIDLGGVGETPPIFAAASGAELTLVSAYEGDSAGAAILVKDASSIRTVSDLRGRKVAVAKGSSANYHLLAALDKEGLTFGDIDPAYLQPPDALAAFNNGSVDAWAIWDPYTAIAEQNLGARVLVNGEGGLSTGLTFLAARPEAVADPGRHAAIADFLARLRKAYTWTTENPDAWAQAWATDTGLTTEIAKVALGRENRVWIPLDDDVAKRLQVVADAFTEAELIPREVVVADFVTDEFNDAVPASAPAAPLTSSAPVSSSAPASPAAS
ncbi:ABC transporter substrate-binding protein [Frankia sp. Mgl5]|uniref:ABC transporter substrate-binding protein n=1 Tax=Frankia sp. Mgl5 TaxID=2933793 RepID=UPI00200EEF63|nr:ABC transporter substrate-binding protein [Frankia sp. Mgl5]MCK9931942.1 ABC transporter substrate-binding protein [Frankia sp. Mgl5]